MRERSGTWWGCRLEFGDPWSRTRRFAGGAVLLVLVTVLTACNWPPRETVAPGGGSHGTTLRLSVKDDVAATLGAEALGGLEDGFDRIDGDLALVRPGTWRGSVTGSSERTIEINVLEFKCKTSLKGTQRLDAVATTGQYPEGRNLRIVLNPVSAPTYAAYPTCNAPPVKKKAANGIEWLDFYLDAYRTGMDVYLPAKPGGRWEWEFSPHPNHFYYGCGDPKIFALCSHTTTLTVEYR